MKRTELELLINDAADGVLSSQEVKNLESALEQYPDLLAEYKAIMAIPDLKKAFPEQGHDIAVYRLKNLISDEIANQLPFEEAGWQWFRKYGAVAAVLIVMISGIIRMGVTGQEVNHSEMIWQELNEPYDRSSAEEYVTMLDEYLLND